MKNLYRLLAASFIVFALAVPVNNAIAERVDVFNQVCPTDPQTAQEIATSKSTACLDKEVKDGNPLFGPDGVMTKIVNILSLAIALVSIVSLMIGGLRYVLSGNEPQEVNNARTRIIYALVALLVAVGAQAVVQFVLAEL